MDAAESFADDGAAASGVGSAPRSFGAWAVMTGSVTAEQLDEAMREGRETGEAPGEVFVRRGWMSEQKVADALGHLSGLAVVSGISLSDDPELLAALSAEQAGRFEACPVSRDDDGKLVVALADPSDGRLRALQARLGPNTRPVIVTQSELRALLESRRAAAVAVQATPSRVATDEGAGETEERVTADEHSLLAEPTFAPALSPAVAIVETADGGVARGSADPPVPIAEPEPAAAESRSIAADAAGVGRHPLLVEFEELTATLDACSGQLDRLRAGLDRFTSGLAEACEKLQDREQRLELLEAERSQDEATLRDVLDLVARRSSSAQG